MAKLVHFDKEGVTELHIQGKFVAGWAKFDLPEDIKGKVLSMIDEAFEAGKRERSNEIKKLLGA